jgi:hypothetical protein
MLEEELVVRVPDPRTIDPDPSIEPRVSLNPAKLKVPLTLRFEVSAMRPDEPRVSVPAEMVVAPV